MHYEKFLMDFGSDVLNKISAQAGNCLTSKKKIERRS